MVRLVGAVGMPAGVQYQSGHVAAQGFALGAAGLVGAVAPDPVGAPAEVAVLAPTVALGVAGLVGAVAAGHRQVFVAVAAAAGISECESHDM